MKGNPKMISTDTHQQFKRALKPAIMKQFPEPRLNSTTIDQLGAGQAPIEVFPPEIFFKGKFKRSILGTLAPNSFFRFRNG